MSSSVVAESADSNKAENTVIIIVNNDGTISVDEQTLQKLLVANQQNASVSVVRVGGGQVEEGSQDSSGEGSTTDLTMSEGQPQVNLTVEGYYPPSGNDECLPTVPADPVVVGTDSLVDPFLEMDPEQLERLETALQSEQAKQILGEGVTAMLDMLTSEDDQSTLKHSIRMDHCYTSCVHMEPDEAGPSGTTSSEPQDSQDSQHEDDVTESEEEADSEEDTSWRRGARTRGRGRAQTRGGRGILTNMRGKARVRGGMKKTASSLPATSTLRTLSARVPATLVTPPLPTRVATPPAPTPIAAVKPDVSVPALTPVRVVPSKASAAAGTGTGTRGTAATRATSQASAHIATASEADDLNVLVIDEHKSASRSRAASQSEPPSKSKRKPNILTQRARRVTTETPAPKPEAPAPTPTPSTPRRASVSGEDKGELSPDAARKMYPKRENRKPPAHLAEAFGPALFSTPDIPRRISDAAKTPEGKSEGDVTEMTEAVQEQGTVQDVKPEVASVTNETPEPVEADSKELLEAELQAVLLGELGDELEQHVQVKDEVVDEAVTETVEELTPVKTESKPSKRRSSVSSKLSNSEVKEMLEEEGSRKRRSGVSKVTAQAIKELQAPSDEEEEKERDEDEESWNSEDDPDRLWCICQKPHNNRFMICCDRCEDWFHGHCVGVTKVMGQQMEEKGQEWTCPPCSKLRQQELQLERAKAAESKRAQTQQGKAPPRRTSTAKSTSTETAPKPADTSKRRKSEDKASTATSSVTLPSTVNKVMCIVCKNVVARSASVYCSDACILKHAQESLNLLSKDKAAKATPTTAAKVEGKVVPASANAVELIVFERKSGQLMTGEDAPTPANLQTWLQKHPSFEVMKPSLLNKLKVEKANKTLLAKLGVKPSTVTMKQPTVKPAAQQHKSTLFVPAQRMPVPIKPAPAVKGVAVTPGKAAPAGAPVKPPTSPTKAKPAVATPVKVTPKVVAKSTATPSASTAIPEKSRKQSYEGGEPIRINVRQALKDTLHSRIQECDDLKVSENEVKGIATTIEEELYSLFKDVGTKYKAKYRSLIFNIKDPKNLALFRKIVTNEVTPNQLVRLSPEELATKELAQWREREAQHTLEMIKKNEMELMSQAIQYVMKTHKGEQVIETDDSLKLQASAVEAESAEPVLEAASSTVEDAALDAAHDSLLLSMDKSGAKKSSSSNKHSSHHKHSHRDSDRRSSRHHDDEKSSRRSSSSRSKHHKDSKDRDSRSKSSKDHSRESSRDSKYQSKSRPSSESSRDSKHKSKHSSEPRHLSSGTPDGDKSSRSSSSLSKTSEHRVKSSKAPTSTSSTPPPIKPEPEVVPVEPPSLEEPVSIVTEDADLSDREPSSTVTIKTPDSNVEEPSPPCVWRGSINMLDVAKFRITAHEVSGPAVGLEQYLADMLDIVGRISPDTVWDYISKMKKTGTKEIVVIRMSASNPEERSSYTCLYTYLSSRNRFGVVGNKCPVIKDFYIMPLSSHSPVPQVLLPLDGPGFEECRPHLLLGIIIRNRRKRPADVTAQPGRGTKETRVMDRSYTPPLPEPRGTGSYTPPLPARSCVIDKEDDAPYSPGGSSDSLAVSPPAVPVEFSSKLEELNRRIEEQKLQIESISSELVCSNSQSASSDTLQVTSLLQQISSQVLLADMSQLVPPTSEYADSPDDENEAYSPSRSFTPPPPAAGTFNLTDTSSISLPSNLQEILASIQRKGPAEVASGLALETDPIVREYASVELPESTTPPPPGTEEEIPQLAAMSRDPRRSQEPVHKSLSKLTEEELIAKANEMLEAVQPDFPPLPPLPPPIAAIPPPPLPPMIEAPLCSPTAGMGEWHAAATDESPRKGISFRVGKRPPQSRWSRSNSSGSQSDKKRSPSPSPPRSKRRHDTNSD